MRGGKKLVGSISISGAKNAALAILPATLLTKEPLIIKNVPDIQDISSMLMLLQHNGVQAEVRGNSDLEHASQNRQVILCSDKIHDLTAPYDLVRKMRASVLVLGPLLARFGEAKVSMPGGCAIGNRPIDIHISALQQMGAHIEIEHGYVHAHISGRLQGAKIFFDRVSVGATENILMASTLAQGRTELHNAAREPEIIDLVRCLRAMGAQISGEGSDVIIIDGIKQLHGAEHILIADRIEAGTYAVAAAITKGELELLYIDPTLIESPLHYLEQCGVEVERNINSVTIRSKDVLHPVNIKTQPYPNFPTDLQAQVMTLLCCADGISHIEETIFENRFMHVPELNRMGAEIEIIGSLAIINGNRQFTGAEVMATDLRASVALILAALASSEDDETIINRIYHLDRGYENLVDKLFRCGANIQRAHLIA